MKKKLSVLPVALLVASLAAAPVYAEEWHATGSPEANGYLVDVTVDGQDRTDEFMYVLGDQRNDPGVPQGITDNLNDAYADLNSVNNLPYQLPDNSGTIESELQQALNTIGSSMTPSELTDYIVFDVSYVPDGTNYQPIDGDIGITVNSFIDGSAYDSEFVIVLHNPETGVWEVLDPSLYEFDENGNIRFFVDSLSPFILLFGDADTIKADPTATATPTPTSAPKSDSTTSPQTGESAGAYLLIIAGALTVAGVVCIKRSLVSSVK